MELSADQGSSQLIEPLYRRRRRILAIVVIVAVVIGLLVSLFTQPEVSAQPKPQEITQAQPLDGQDAQDLPEGQQEPQIPQEQQGTDITRVLFQFGQWVISFIAVLSSIVELTGVNMRDLFGSRAAKTNVEEFPFYVYQDFDKLLAYLFPDPKTPLLPDRDIKYLPQISSEADAALQGRGMVLIRGGSKTGKTREACEMLRRWWYSGPTVLVVRSHVGLYPPFKIPENLPLRNLVIFFDDIDRYLGNAASLKRLDETLKFFQEICHNRGEISVVATARQEEEFWEKLKFDPAQTPWNKFELIQLNPLSTEKALEVITELSKTSGIAIEPELAKTLAEKNNGTFLNLALAFRGWLSQKITTITPNEIKTFEGSLKHTWRKRYEELAASNPRIKPVYAAIDFMQSHNISLRPELIAQLAAEMALGKGMLSALGLIAKLQNWFDMSPMFNWYRNAKQRRKGWALISIAGILLLYLLIYALLRFVPGDIQIDFFETLPDSRGYQLLCLSPLWALLIPFAFYTTVNVLRNWGLRRTKKDLDFLLDTTIPVRGDELRPYENQFEGNGNTHNWDAQNYAGEIQEKRFVSNASHIVMDRYLELAEQLRVNGEFSPARKLAILAQSIAPDHPAPVFMLGKIETDEENFRDALELFKASQGLYHRSNNVTRAKERQALLHLFLEEYESAEQLAGKALKEMPDLLIAHWVLGLAQIKQGKIQDGQDNCRLAFSSDKIIPGDIQKVMGILGVGQGEWTDVLNTTPPNSAKSTFRKWRGFIGKSAVFLSILILSVAFFVLIPYADFRYWFYGESGISLNTTLLKVFSNSPAITVQRGIAYLNQSEKQQAIIDFSEAIRLDPEFTYAYLLRGYAYKENGEYEKAIADYTEAIRVNSKYTAEAYVARGEFYEETDENEKAVADYTEAIHANSEYAYAYYRRGEFYEKIGENEKSVEDYAEAFRLESYFVNNCKTDLCYTAVFNNFNPNDAVSYEYRGDAYEKNSEHEKAVADYTESIHIDPKYAPIYMARGDIYNILGENEKAVADYTEAIRLDSYYASGWSCKTISCYAAVINVLKPNDPTTYEYRGNAYKKLGKYKEAVADFSEIIHIDPNNIAAYYSRGEVYTLLDEYENAIADYTAIINRNPEDFHAYMSRGKVYEKNGEDEKAMADYSQANRLSANRLSDSPRDCYGLCYDAQIAVDVETLTARIELDPNDALAYVNRGDAYYSLEEYDRAIADYDHAIRIDAQYALAYYYRGRVYEAKGETEKALADYTESIRIDPSNTETRKGRGDFYNNLGEYEKAMVDYEKIILLDPNSARYCNNIPCYTAAINNLHPSTIQDYANRGNAYEGLGKYSEAITDYSEAIRLDPRIPTAYERRGYLYFNNKEYEKSIIDYSAVIRIDPTNYFVYSYRSIAYENIGEYEKAIDDYTRYINRLRITDDPLPPGVLGNAYMSRGEVYEKLGKTDKAIADYKDAIRSFLPGHITSDNLLYLTTEIELDPKIAFIYAARGSVYYNRSEYEKAIADYTEAIRLQPDYAEKCDNISCYIAAVSLNPNDATIYYRRGRAYYDSKEYEKAIADYTASIKIDPSQFSVYYDRGNIYLKLEKYREAVADYTEAIRIDPNHASAYMARGGAYEKIGEYDKATADYTAASPLRKSDVPICEAQMSSTPLCLTTEIHLHPNSSILYIHRGDIYNDLGEHDKAVEDYKEAIRIDPEYTHYCGNILCYNVAIDTISPKTADEFSGRGFAYYSLGEYEKAIADYTEAILRDPKYAKAYKGRGDVYAKLGKDEKAFVDYAEEHTIYINLNPTNADAYSNRALLYYNFGEYEKSVVDYTEAIRLSQPSDMPSDTLYNNRCSAYDFLGEFQKAIEDCTEAIRLTSTLANSYNWRGYAYGRLGEYEEAFEDFNQAVRFNPDYFKTYYYRGEIYLSRGEYEKAIADFTEAINRITGNEVQDGVNYTLAYQKRGEAYQALGMQAEADADFQKYKELLGP